MATPAPTPPHRPGSISLFFVAKAAVFAAGFWIWLAVMTIGGGSASGLEILAATGAITTTGVSVVLGVRMALQHNAAERHAELKRLLVDISWNAFAAAGNADSPANVVPFPTVAYDATATARRRSGDNGDERRH
jgi:hypothetical protein